MSGRAFTCALCVCLWVAAASCSGGKTERASAVLLVGDPVRGERIARAAGCAACHRIPGLHEPGGEVGPPLWDFARRTYIAGVLPNTPQNLTRWIMDPPALRPQTAMPDLGLSEPEAQDVAAFLNTLE